MDCIATPAVYRTRITHLRRAPAHYYFEHRSYSWYVDVDELPRLPWWLRGFARFDARDHFDGAEDHTLRQRIDAFLAAQGAPMPGGRITALLQARVLGYAFHPLSLFWCHDGNGVLRRVVAEVHNTHGERHPYLLPSADTPVLAAKRLYASPFHPVDGHYLVRAPRPDRVLDVMVSLHCDDQPAFVAAMRRDPSPRHRRAGGTASARHTVGVVAGSIRYVGSGGGTVVGPRTANAVGADHPRRQRGCVFRGACRRDRTAEPKCGVVKHAYAQAF